MKLCQVRGEAGQTLLEALRIGQQHIDAPCGGKTRCVRCMVRVGEEDTAPSRNLAASLSTNLASFPAVLEEPEQLERELVGSKRLADGWRLACRARFVAATKLAVTIPDAKLEIPDFPVRKSKHRQKAGTITDLTIAVDIGTTTVVAILADLRSGDILGRVAKPNRQRSWGADVVSRIEAAITAPASLASMHDLIHAQIEGMLQSLKQQAGLASYPPIFLSGNTTMLHLFEGEDLRGLAVMPFTPAFLDSRTTTAGPSAIPVHLVSGISAFVGADIMAGLYACGFDQPVSAPRLLVDIGTNGEMALALPDGIFVTATAAGPAFEGELISSGSPAVEGAIDHVWLDEDEIHFSTIGSSVEQTTATGICGSGLLDLLACLRRLEIVDETGAFTCEPPQYTFGEDGPVLTQRDVRNLQLAKGAIAAGIEILCQRAGIESGDIETLYLAGGFGSTLLPASALDIGLLPGTLAGRVEVAGNSALSGTLLLAAQPECFNHMTALRERITVVELAREAGFQDAFMDAMLFPEFT